jgi:putative transcriptional regulator
MSGDFAPIDLTNHFLIAMPGLEDALFAKSVVYVCEHTSKGALGLVINKPAQMAMGELFQSINLPLTRQDMKSSLVFRGGPLQLERGFVLHGPSTPTGLLDDAGYASSLAISGGLEMTTSKDVLDAMSRGEGPGRVFISLGYSAWGAGQLESELGANSWLTFTADQDIIFNTPVSQRYDKALALLGLESWMISTQIGHA